jgi:hypothetical protein
MEIADLFLKSIGIPELMIKSEESNNLLMVKVLFLILRVHFMKVMLKILRDSKKQENISILKLRSVWNFLILRKMFLQDLVEIQQLQVIGGQIMPMKMIKKEALLIELPQEEVEEATEDEVIEEITLGTEVVSNHMVMIELIISKSEEDIIKREVHGEVEVVIVEDVFGMSEFMKFKLYCVVINKNINVKFGKLEIKLQLVFG